MSIRPFDSEEAPCGQTESGERHVDRDEECVLFDEKVYACGCRIIRNEYHDGTFSRKVVHHDGTVLIDRNSYKT